MRFLVIADQPDDPNSGAAGTVIQTNSALKRLGHEVDVILADDLGPRRIRHGNLHSLLEQPRAYATAALRAVSRKPYDVVMISQPQGWLAAKQLKSKEFPGIVINRSHGHEIMADRAVTAAHRALGIPEGRLPYRWLTPLLRKALHRQWHLAARYFDGFIVPAEDISAFLVDEQAIRSDRVAMIHHGAAPGFLKDPPRPLTRERLNRILHVSQFSFFKAPHIVARVFSELARRHEELEFTWVCSEEHHDMACQLLEPVAVNRVQFEGWRPQEELVNLFDEHGVFVFPSFYEGAGKVSLEAMSRGLCVVSTSVGAMQDYIQNGTSGLLVSPCDAGATTDAVSALLGDFDRSGQMASQAIRATNDKTWSECARRAVEFFQRWLEEAG